MRNVWGSISELGIKKGLPEMEVQSVVFTNRINIILLLCVLSSIAINLILGDYKVVPALTIAVFPLLLTFFFQYKTYYLAARINIIITCLALLIFILFSVGSGGGIEFYFLTLTILPAVIFTQKRLIFIFQALCILSLISLKIYEHNYSGIIDKSSQTYYVFYLVNGVYSGLLIIIAIAFFKNQHLKSLAVLRNSFQKIEEQNRKLELTNKNLERSNSDLEQFAYVASHDLKEPLRMISSYATLLTRKAMPNDPDAQTFSHFISEGVDRMQNLINDLLSFSRIGNDKAPFVKTDLNNIFRDVKKQLSLIIDETDAVIDCAELPAITCIPSQLGQVFYNLLGNALKFRKSHVVPHVHIEVKNGEKYWLFSIKDNGIGIAPAYQERIFDIFQRLHGHDKYAGTGIGLALCKRIIELHGGYIWLQSEPENGATFFFTISKELLPNENDKHAYKAGIKNA